MLKRWLIKKACQILDKYDAWPPPVILYRESPSATPTPSTPTSQMTLPLTVVQRTVARNFSKM